MGLEVLGFSGKYLNVFVLVPDCMKSFPNYFIYVFLQLLSLLLPPKTTSSCALG